MMPSRLRLQAVWFSAVVSACSARPSTAVSRPEPVQRPATPDLTDCTGRRGAGYGGCCEHDFGLNPRFVAEACGLSQFIGEKRELGWCALTFMRAGIEVRLGLEDLDGLSWDSAIALQEDSLVPGLSVSTVAVASDARVHWTRGDKQEWLLVPGWSRPRRLSLPAGSCSEAGLRRIAAAMARASERPAVYPSPVGDAPLVGTHEGAGGSLMTRVRERPGVPMEEGQPVPKAAKRMIYNLLTVAERGDTGALPGIVVSDARWGLPDRRQLDAHPILASDAGVGFLAHLRRVASRFSRDNVLYCPKLSERAVESVRAGEHPMWCYYSSADRLEFLVFRLRMHRGDGRIDYVGFYITRPTGPVPVPQQLPVPPLLPLDPPVPR